jgi:hypothetical protein
LSREPYIQQRNCSKVQMARPINYIMSSMPCYSNKVDECLFQLAWYPFSELGLLLSTLTICLCRIVFHSPLLAPLNVFPCPKNIHLVLIWFWTFSWYIIILVTLVKLLLPSFPLSLAFCFLSILLKYDWKITSSKKPVPKSPCKMRTKIG